MIFTVRTRTVKRNVFVSFGYYRPERVTQVVVEETEAGIIEIFEPVTPRNIRRARRLAKKLDRAASDAGSKY